MRKLTQEEFIIKARQAHGDKYDYSKAKYVNYRTNILITCPIHGDFLQIPKDHISGRGCMQCGRISTVNHKKGKASVNNRHLIYGVGINDYDGPIFINGKPIPSYDIWHSMLTRCYSKRHHLKAKSYIGCSVCTEWLSFSNFKKWFDSEGSGYREGYQLDKDILIKGNKLYSPETCVFVPQQINSLFCLSSRVRGEFPLGVFKRKNRYYSYCMNGTERKHLGSYKTIEDAFASYKQFKESRIKSMANSYFSKDMILPKVHRAMCNYEITITD